METWFQRVDTKGEVGVWSRVTGYPANTCDVSALHQEVWGVDRS
jgi:hypothetical protein